MCDSDMGTVYIGREGGGGRPAGRKGMAMLIQTAQRAESDARRAPRQQQQKGGIFSLIFLIAASGRSAERERAVNGGTPHHATPRHATGREAEDDDGFQLPIPS